MKFGQKAQASIEMLLLIGAAVAIAAIVGVMLKQAATAAGEGATNPTTT